MNDPECYIIVYRNPRDKGVTLYWNGGGFGSRQQKAERFRSYELAYERLRMFMNRDFLYVKKCEA